MYQKYSNTVNPGSLGLRRNETRSRCYRTSTSVFGGDKWSNVALPGFAPKLGICFSHLFIMFVAVAVPNQSNYVPHLLADTYMC